MQSSLAPSMGRANDFIREIKREFPDFRIVDKRGHWPSHLIDLALKLVTLGGQRDYLTHYHTVLGDTLYVPDSWATTSDAERLILLRHERIHLRQRRRLGTITMAFVYLIPFLPMGLAYGRARLEWQAYEETLRATAEVFGLEHARSPTLRRRIVSRFTGPAYGFMWPFSKQVNAWYDRALARLKDELCRQERKDG